MPSHLTVRALAHAFLHVFFLFTLCGCGFFITGYAKLRDNGNPEPDPSIGQDPFIRDVARRFGLMALFAQVVYREDVGDAERDALCSSPGESQSDSGMPFFSDGTGRWSRMASTTDVAYCVNDGNGLFYETYVFRNGEGTPLEAVIAFRGTENYNGQTRLDWKTNLSALFGFEPPQYELALERLSNVISALSALNQAGEIPIYVVGHSLGGGLAQQAGYRFAEVDAVYTFNTSPVTN